MAYDFLGELWMCSSTKNDKIGHEAPLAVGMFENRWQGRLDSNQRMPRSKPGALPLGDAPNAAEL